MKTKKESERKMETSDLLGAGVAFFVALLVIAVLLGAFATVVPAGYVGIVDYFGVVSDEELPPAWHWKSPLVGIVPMTVKTQELKEISTVPSNEGLLVTLETSILYRVEPETANELYKKVGTEYAEIVIQPQLRSVIREVTARYEAKALYTSAREQITKDIFEVLQPLLAERGIILENVLLRDLGLPQKVTEAIEAKLKAEQEAEQMDFLLLKEEKEATRKKIEAEGIRISQEIIDKTLTEKYLQYLWVQTLNENPNVMYVATEAGLPLFREVGG